MQGSSEADRTRPSWQQRPCPDWCTRLHREDDHPEDRIHQDDGIVIPATIALIDPATLSRIPEQAEILVRRTQAVHHEERVWLFIGDVDLRQGITVSSEVTPQLRDSLP